MYLLKYCLRKYQRKMVWTLDLKNIAWHSEFTVDLWRKTHIRIRNNLLFLYLNEYAICDYYVNICFFGTILIWQSYGHIASP